MMMMTPAAKMLPTAVTLEGDLPNSNLAITASTA
jgi:hypothetical protein